MGYCKQYTIDVTTGASSGAGSGVSLPIYGTIQSVRYVKTDFADGSTFALTTTTSGKTIWSETGVNASATRCPREASHTTLGAADTYDGTHAVLVPIAVGGETLTWAVTSAGNSKSGTLYIVVETG